MNGLLETMRRIPQVIEGLLLFLVLAPFAVVAIIGLVVLLGLDELIFGFFRRMFGGSSPKSLLALLLLLSLAGVPARAQYVAPYVAVTGALSSSNGMPAQNYVISFQPTQLFFVAGTSVVVSGSTCATDVSGSVVGVRNPLTQAIVAPQYSGSLPAGNYYVAVTWYDTYTHQTLTSPVASAQLTSTGALVISPPAAGAPANALGMDVYIGGSPSTLQYQGQTTSPTATYTQSAVLASGAAPPTRNGTVCQVVANDAGWPTGTGYNVSITNASGNTMPGYPMQWQFLSPGSTYNLSNGLPYYNGRVTYPVPVLTEPYNHNLQSIDGPLSMGTPGGIGYNITNVGELGVGTTLPAYGVDVEGTGLAGQINAIGGYLSNGAAPTNHVLLGNGTAYVDSATLPYSILSGAPSLYYQTVDSNGTAMTQRPALNFSPRFSLSDLSSPAETTVDLASIDTAGSCTVCSLSYDVYGRVTSASSAVLPTGYVASGTVAGCVFSSDGNGLFCSPGTLTLNAAMPNTSYNLVCNPNFSNAMMTTTSALPALFVTGVPATTTTVTIYEAVNSGSSTGYGISTSYGVTVACIAQEQ